MPAVSIIIPTFNRARFLGQAIESALAQAEMRELIVVDDGSTDRTDEVLDRFAGRITVLRQPNRGVSEARNRGAEHASGDYLFLLDSDDLLIEGVLSATVAFARTLEPHQVAFGQARTLDEAGHDIAGPLYGYPAKTAGQTLTFAELLGGIMPLWLILLRRETYLNLRGLRTDLSLGEDQEFAVRAYNDGIRFVATGFSMTCLRVHLDERLSGPGDRCLGMRLLQLWGAIAALAENSRDYDNDVRQSLARVIWIAARDVARQDDRPRAEQLFALARSVFPKAGADSPAALRAAYKVLPPYRVERLLEGIKALTLFSRALDVRGPQHV